MNWIKIEDSIPQQGFLWKDENSGQHGIGSFDPLKRPHFISSGGINPWFFKDWTSITHWMPLPQPPEKDGMD